MPYRAPVADMLFTMTHAAGLEEGLYPDLGDGAAASILDEAAKMAEGVLAPLYRIGDREGATFANGTVTTATGWPDAYRRWTEGGWMGVTAPEAHGGMGLPHLLNAGCIEAWNGANMAFALAPLLSVGAIEALVAHGSEDLRRIYLDRVVSGEWAATMNLTEPQAGSDLAALRTRAERAPDGSYKITGQKIFITYGEHDLTPNILHLVLARLPDAPAGTRGISLFLVPKFLVREDGQRGAHNDLRCGGIEHKMGIHGSPTCTMIFGDDGGATGYLIGEENRGLPCMFTMMNNARLSVGLQGVGVAERATQTAIAFASERRQGRAPGASGEGMSPIVDHPDVRRMLLTMKATTSAARAICYMTAQALDQAHRGTTPEARRAGLERAGLLTPVAKAYATDTANEVASLGVQVHGGMGFIEETGAAQLMRDARIAGIYEGTNGIQAIDLVQRKLSLSGGAAFKAELDSMREVIARLQEQEDPRFGTMPRRLSEAVEALFEGSETLLEQLAEDPAVALAGATPYLRLFALARGGTALASLAMAENAESGTWLTQARFFAENVACAAPSLASTIAEGASCILAADAALAV
ncbi:MAG: acyl-CoA dehydrogenase [Hyphomicrobiales bacterium]|nr:acyl-CoA dehydrogenase [Hyphomicrobiales bacterium]